MSNRHRGAPAAEEVLTLDETALFLRISKRTLERLLEAGAFPPAVKIGQQWRVHRPALEAYLAGAAAAQRSQAGTAPSSAAGRLSSSEGQHD